MITVTGTGRCGTTLALKTLKDFGVAANRVFGADLKDENPVVVCYRNKKDTVKSMIRSGKEEGFDYPDSFYDDAFDAHLSKVVDHVYKNLSFVVVEFDSLIKNPKGEIKKALEELCQ